MAVAAGCIIYRTLSDYLIVDQYQPRAEWYHRTKGQVAPRVKTAFEDIIEMESI